MFVYHGWLCTPVFCQLHNIYHGKTVFFVSILPCSPWCVQMVGWIKSLRLYYTIFSPVCVYDEVYCHICVKKHGTVCYQLTLFPSDYGENIYNSFYHHYHHHHHHHQIGNMIHWPLLKVRSHGVCVFFFIWLCFINRVGILKHTTFRIPSETRPFTFSL